MNLVLPRDLFNHSKILKCMGRLSLLIFDGQMDAVSLDLTGNNFNVYQDNDTGCLGVSNLKLYTRRGKEIILFSHYNSKSNYPLWFTLENEDQFCEGLVFDDDGNLTESFLDLIDLIREENL